MRYQRTRGVVALFALGGLSSLIYLGARTAYRAGISQGRLDTRTTGDPFGMRPLLVFDDTTIAWNDLVPNLGATYGPAFPRRVLGTFPVSDNSGSIDVAEVMVNEDQLVFPRAGEYYLHTSVGYFKILIVTPNKPDDEIQAIARFVARNTLHSVADARIIQPNVRITPYRRPDKLLPKLFASDQPLLLHCGHVAELLVVVLTLRGHRAQTVGLFSSPDEMVHIVTQAWFPNRKKFVLIDPDYGAMIRDSDNLLSISEIATASRDENPRLSVVPLSDKKRLYDRFNAVEGTHSSFAPSFTWTPAKMSDRPMLVPRTYLSLLRSWSFAHALYEHNSAFQSRLVEKRRYDGVILSH